MTPAIDGNTLPNPFPTVASSDAHPNMIFKPLPAVGKGGVGQATREPDAKQRNVARRLLNTHTHIPPPLPAAPPGSICVYVVVYVYVCAHTLLQTPHKLRPAGCSM